jgi:hypothetical protein
LKRQVKHRSGELAVLTEGVSRPGAGNPIARAEVEELTESLT